IETLTRDATPSRFSSSIELSAPRLPDNIPVLETYWQISVPAAHYLFSQPDNFAAAFQWRRSGLIWMRVPDLTTQALGTWVGTLVPDSQPADTLGRNTYLFTRAGTAESLSVRTMRQGSIVLLGAGTALLMGWLLVTVRRMRHVLTFLTA